MRLLIMEQIIKDANTMSIPWVSNFHNQTFRESWRSWLDHHENYFDIIYASIKTSIDDMNIKQVPKGPFILWPQFFNGWEYFSLC